jgi:hypothetical protein
MKDLNQAIREDFDFGFTDEVSPIDTDFSKAKRIYNLILPLLANLEKDADTKDHIYWPNRRNRIADFRDKLTDIINE